MANMTKVRSTNSALVVKKRLQESQGSDVASASTITLPNDGNFFDLTGTTAVKHITYADWTPGSRVILQADGSITVHDDEGTIPAGTGEILLAAGGDYAMTVGDLLELVWDGTAWKEVGRTVVT